MKITVDNIINFMKTKQNLIINDKQVKEIKNIFIKMLKNQYIGLLLKETDIMILGQKE